MQATRRLFNQLSTPKWHQFFHKSSEWQTGCACANQGALWFTDTIFCLTRRWSTASAEWNQVRAVIRSRDITLGDVFRTTLFAVQLGLIFKAGIAVGRGSLQGYYHGPSIHEVWEEEGGHH